MHDTAEKAQTFPILIQNIENMIDEKFPNNAAQIKLKYLNHEEKERLKHNLSSLISQNKRKGREKDPGYLPGPRTQLTVSCFYNAIFFVIILE
jgi:hypothetical protein